MDDRKFSGQFSTPESLIALIAELSNGIPANKILDPACGSATLLISVAKDRQNVDVTGIEVNQSMVSRAKDLLQISETKHRLIHGDFFFTQLDEKFDLAVCIPPFGMKFEKEIDGIKVRGTESAFILLSLQLLKPSGYAIFIVPEGLLSNESNRIFRDYILQKYSLHAVISLPADSFRPLASVKTSLLVLKNSKQEKRVFFAEFAEPQALKTIVTNFQQQTSNQNLSQGFWVEVETIQRAYTGWNYWQYKAIKDFEIKKANSKYPLRLLSELATIGKCESNVVETILIQRVSSQPKVIMKHELNEATNPKNYIELSLSSDEILPQYLKLYLNSEQGKTQIYSMIGSGGISPLNLESIYIEVPDLGTQIQIVSTAQKFLEVLTTVQVLTQSFYSHLFNYSELLPLIERFNKADEKDGFCENLISPLAASFRIATKGSPNINSQLDSYFKMFEMITILNSTVLLSALPQRLREQHEKDIWKDQKKQYKKASFGSWVSLYRNLASLYRQLKKLDSKKKPDERILDTLPFGADFYLNLSNKELLDILDLIPQKRNEFGGAGHGGIVPEIVIQKVVNDLHPSLIKVFEKLSDAYSALDLIYPQTMKKSSGLYTIKIKRLQGTHYPYAEQEIQAETDLNTESLYLYNSVSKARLELLSELIKLVQCEHCGRWSIYFYSKIDGEKSHYISYQNEIHGYTDKSSGLLISIGDS